MREPRIGQQDGTYYLVLNRSCADLYEEIAEVFEDRPYAKVVVDLRRGKGRMTEIPSGERRGARIREGQVNPRLVSMRLRKEES